MTREALGLRGSCGSKYKVHRKGPTLRAELRVTSYQSALIPHKVDRHTQVFMISDLRVVCQSPISLNENALLTSPDI